jgi:hypothetical protein
MTGGLVIVQRPATGGSRRGQRPSAPGRASAEPAQPAFNPTLLRDKTPKQQREALLSLMRYDQDMLAVAKKRHMDRSAVARGARFGSKSGASSAMLTRGLVGRNEQTM